MNEEEKIKTLDDIRALLYAYAESEGWQEEIIKMNEASKVIDELKKVIEELKEDGWIV